jgi:hypothetical protein
MITTLMNKIYEMVTFPAVWKSSFHMINKRNGELKDSVNYRDISLLSGLSEIYIGVLPGRMILWIEKKGIICDFRWGSERAGTSQNTFLN